MKECCKKEKSGIKEGILYGLVPHIGCIAFIVFTILGVTVAAAFFKPLLTSRYLFYGLIALSLLFATLSALFYLKRNSSLSIEGIRSKKNYLLTLYGTTLAVNLLFFFVIFPAVANISLSGKAISETNSNLSYSSLILNVNIPCSGHAPLIISELNKVNGIKDVTYENGNFKVIYDSSIISKEKILNAEIFKEFPANII
jgi:copper chaperone CopZ